MRKHVPLHFIYRKLMKAGIFELSYLLSNAHLHYLHNENLKF